MAAIKNMTWREYRTCSPKQNLALDFLTKQGAFRNDTERSRILLYGGAGWGGKSHLLRTAGMEISLVLRNLGFPNQWTTLFTATYPDLTDRHVRKFEDELSAFGVIRETRKRGLHFQFFEEGLGGIYLRNVADMRPTGKNKGKTKRGAESIGALIDESTELTYDQFAGQILYQIRPSDQEIPFIPICAATNPDGVGHRWNKEIFVPQYRKLDHQFFKKNSPKSVFFIQAKKEDNPAYSKQKDIIDARMSSFTDEDVRRAREDGAWDLYASGRFPNYSEQVHEFTDQQLLDAWGIPSDVSFQEFIEFHQEFGFSIETSLDYGTSTESLSVYFFHLIDPNGNPWTFDCLVMSGLPLPVQAEKILMREHKWCSKPLKNRVCDPALRGRAAESDNRIARIDRFRNLGVAFVPGINDRVEGAATVEFMLHWTKGENDEVAIPPRWRIHKTRCKGLCEEIPELPRNPINPEDVDPCDGKWHHYDSARYFLHTKFRTRLLEREKKVIVPYTAEYYRAVMEMNKDSSGASWKDLLS